MNLQTKFIYQVITAAAYYVIIAGGVEEAKAEIPADVEEVIKLGCVTKDVHDSTTPGIVCREWRPV